MELPKDFTKNILEVYGADGAAWLKDLPERLSFLSCKWNLQSLKPVENLSYNFVAQAVFTDGRRMILKMGSVAADYAKEISWLSAYQGLAWGLLFPCLKVFIGIFLSHHLMTFSYMAIFTTTIF